MKKLFFDIDLIYLKKVDSTNIYLSKITNNLKDWTIVWTNNQTDGKGNMGNTWISEKNKNLIFSIYLNPGIIIKDYFFLNIITSNAIHKILSLYCNNIWIKWPNDIILMDKKIGGILIENKIYKKNIIMTIIGIGINVNQTYFGNIFQASSINKLLGIKFNIQKLLINIIFFIQKEFIIYNKYGKEIIKNYYIKHLYKINEISTFKIYKSQYNGIIKNITEDGKLSILLEIEKKLNYFSNKEIKLKY